MGRKRKHQQTDSATEAASSSSTAKERSSGRGGKISRLMTGSPDLGTQKSKVTIHQLDDLPLMEIFSNLDMQSKSHVARVCRRWRDLVYSPALWKHTTARLDPRSLSLADLESLQRRGIRRVVVLKGTNDEKLRTLVYGLSLLETLDFSRIKMTNRRLTNVFPESLPLLKKLVLSLDMLNVPRMDYVAHVFQNLSHLELDAHSSRERFSDSCEPAQMPSLTSLRIPHTCMAIGDPTLRYLSRAFPNLQEFSALPSNDVSDDGMQRLATLKKIQKLELHCWAMPPFSSTLAAKFQHLHVLKIISRKGVGNEELSALALLPELEELAIHRGYCIDEGWRVLDQGFRKLKCLTLCHVRIFQATELRHFGSLPALETIAFKGLIATDLHMKSLCSALKQIHTMTIMFARGRNHPYMKDISDMENLKNLRLYWTLIGDEDLKELANGKANLEKLTVIDCDMHGECLLHIARQKKSLRKLELSVKMNEAKLCQIVQELPDLQELKANVTAAAKWRLQDLKPGLRVLCYCNEDRITILSDT